MRAEFDFAPLYRSSIGFDRIFNLLNNAQRLHPADAWPPYNIVRRNENEYVIEVAVAGFATPDLDITQERNVLLVKGDTARDVEGDYLHRGISVQNFERRFELADHVRVGGASLANGLLTITLERAVPERAKPRRIGIGNGDGPAVSEPIQIEADSQAT